MTYKGKVDSTIISNLNYKYYKQCNLMLVIERNVKDLQVVLYTIKPRTSYKILYVGKSYAEINRFLNGLNQGLLDYERYRDID
jgi:hypothetical protein